MTEISGSCLCGQVSFTGTVDIIRVANCHCADCQKATGATYGTLLFAEEKTLRVEGETSTYEHKADSGNTLSKINCSTCGSPMFTYNSSRGGMGIRAGVIDQKELITPAMNLFCDRAINTTPIDKTLKNYSGMPT